MNYTDKLTYLKTTDVNPEGWITCPNCKERHGLFYRKHSNTTRTLNYFCNKVKTYWWEDDAGTGRRIECWKHVTRLGECDMVDGLPINEDWTAKCKSNFQKDHTKELVP